MDVAQDRAGRVVGEGESVRGDDRAGGTPRRGRRRPAPSDGPARQPDPGRVQLRSAAQHLVGWPDGERAAAGVQGQDHVGQRPGLVDPMLDEHDGRPALPADRPEVLEECLRPRRVQVGGRLVQHEHPRAWRERPGEGQSLLLSTRELLDEPLPRPFEPDLSERRRHALAHRRTGPAEVLQPEGDVVPGAVHDELAGRVLEHHPHGSPDPERADPAPRNLAWHEAGQRQRERALARS